MHHLFNHHCLHLMFLSSLLITNLALANPKMLGFDRADKVEGQYIVVMKANESSIATNRAELVTEFSAMGQIVSTFQHAIQGFTIRASQQSIADIANRKDVEFVEVDSIMSINGEQTDPTWGLDRIDARQGSDSIYRFSMTGKGVHAYVIDTGLRTSHSEFSGRVGEGFSAVGGVVNDCEGHGTHVSGTLAGSNFGVAKDAIVHPVRVFDCSGSGTVSSVVAGLDWVTANAQMPAVANMSLGGGASNTLDMAVINAIRAGITVVVAAGNSNTNACSGSPSGERAAITVGASTPDDKRSSFSNTGRCVDLFAPGSGVLSASIQSDTGLKILSGTSMASPHVAGAVALLLEAHPEDTPLEITSRLLKNATKGVLTNIGSRSPNLFLYTNPEGVDPDPLPEPDPIIYQGEIGEGRFVTVGEQSHQFVGFNARLEGPVGANFDLILQKAKGFAWENVAFSREDESGDTIEYFGSSGIYRWQINAVSGSGGFTLTIN